MSPVLLAMILTPALGSALNGLVVRTPHPKRAGVLASLIAAISFLCAVLLYVDLVRTGTPAVFIYDWFAAGSLKVHWGFRFDELTSIMALVVTGIGTLIHVYSIGYMSHEPTPSRYFAYLNLFLFSMLTLICADNLVVMFVGWEGVGLCSYLLIGYWYQDREKAAAGMKAFIVNRIGDAGFLLGIFLCYQLFGTIDFSSMAEVLKQMISPSIPLLNVAAFCLFVGAMGKSAQIPLFVWLPDAMAGPTPVSALIHAATMVTAGVFLVVRMNFLFSTAAETSLIIAFVGGATALLAALIATSQNDIKKVLAYSTVSQLGLMFLALGSGAYVAGLFHVVTHAFFKALLFLGAGSVIHALDGEQDIQHMGGLKKKLPVTFATFAIGTAALCGLPPMSGFFSKDMILHSAMASHHYGMLLWAIGSVASLLTAFYMTRLFVLVFLGDYRGQAHPHESPSVMTIPLLLLAVGSVIAGVLELPHGSPILPATLSHYLAGLIPAHEGHAPISELGAMALATLGAIVAVSIGFYFFSDRKRAESTLVVLRPFRAVFANKFWVDELYGVLFITPFEKFSAASARIIDPKIVDAGIMFPSKVARAGGTLLSFFQIGSAQFYLLIMLLGAVFVVWSMLKTLMVF